MGTAVIVRREIEPPALVAQAGPSDGVPLKRLRREMVIDVCDGLIDMMGELFGISGRELRRPGRADRDVTRVRQVAMYVAHVTLRLTMGEIAVGFQRDRTTVLYACNLVEAWRDDASVDQMVGFAERLATAAFGKVVSQQ